MSDGGSSTDREVRIPFDLDAYVERSRNGPCFICAIVRGDQRQHVVYRDERHIAFLPDMHVLRGYVLVAPVEHRERVLGDFSEDEYLTLQALVRRVGRALSLVVPTERVYVLSLGSNDGNAHVHWHIAALPPGVPYEDQQYRALMAESKGVLAMTADEQEELARSLRRALES
jgi:diadenosine tetraphosphate (Ap4A) HIT family hydrolase